MRREENYYRGREDGNSVEFDKNGEILSQGEFLEGFEEGKWFYHVGDHVEKGLYKGGERDGVWQYDYSTGEKKFSGAYIQGYANGRHRFYYKDGSIREDRFYEMGRKEKIWRKYDSLGNITLTLTYSHDILVRINGVKVNLDEVGN